MIDLLAQLSNEIGVSGAENAIRALLISALKEHVADITVDTMGNVYASKKAASPSEKTVMLTAHMDEVGLMITGINSGGLLKFTTVGSIDVRLLPGSTVLVGPNKLPGVIGLEAIHNTPASQRDVAPSADSLLIDIGADSKEAASGKVSIGDYASFNTQFGSLNPALASNGMVKGKALDNRAGCAMLIELLKQNHPVNVLGVFTVQEEIGMRGAKVAAHKTNPDFAIVLECTLAGDVPTDPEKPLDYPYLGQGPCISLMDSRYIANRPLVKKVEALAARHNIPLQYKKPNLGWTDAGTIHTSRAGIPTLVLAPPARYLHSPASVMNLNDAQNCIKLVSAILQEMETLI